jgi:hypothetical protein
VTSSDAGAGPATHYELFAGLRDGGVTYLVTGATALVLHGVPRLTPDIDLAVDPHPANLERLERLLAAWGYVEAPYSLGKLGFLAALPSRHVGTFCIFSACFVPSLVRSHLHYCLQVILLSACFSLLRD